MKLAKRIEKKLREKKQKTFTFIHSVRKFFFFQFWRWRWKIKHTLTHTHTQNKTNPNESNLFGTKKKEERIRFIALHAIMTIAQVVFRLKTLLESEAIEFLICARLVWRMHYVMRWWMNHQQVYIVYIFSLCALCFWIFIHTDTYSHVTIWFGTWWSVAVNVFIKFSDLIPFCATEKRTKPNCDYIYYANWIYSIYILFYFIIKKNNAKFCLRNSCWHSISTHLSFK